MLITIRIRLDKFQDIEKIIEETEKVKSNHSYIDFNIEVVMD